MWPKGVSKSSRKSYWKRRKKEKVQQQLLIMLKSKPRAKGCFFAMLRINWPSPKIKSLHLRRNWRRPRRQRSKQRGLRIRPSRMGTTLEWQRPRKPSGLRSLHQAPKRGMKLSTRLGLRLHPCLERQRSYTTPYIRRSVPSVSRIDAKPEGAKVSKDSTTNVTTSFAILSEEAKQPGAIEKEKNANQRVAPDAMKPRTPQPIFSKLWPQKP